MREGIRGEQGEGNEGVCGWVGGSLMYTETTCLTCIIVHTTASYLHSVIACIQ